MTLNSVTIRDADSGAVAKILVDFGFNCYQFLVHRDGKEIDVLWAAEGFAGGGERPSGSGIPILFPFPGRIQGTELQWEGKQYLLREGDGRGNAIHGFVHERPWRIVQQEEDRLVGQFQASLDDPALLNCWPADFCITAEYRLQGDCLLAEYTIENPDQRALPCGLGTHPYFRIPLGGTEAGQCQVRLPVSHGWELDGMIVTGRQLPLDNGAILRDGIPFSEMKYDNVFGGLEFDGQMCRTSIHDPSSGVTVQQSSDKSFRELVVYNPPHREALCIEPYSCLPDPFRLTREGIDAGLRVLQPDESWQSRVEIEVR